MIRILWLATTKADLSLNAFSYASETQSCTNFIVYTIVCICDIFIVQTDWLLSRFIFHSQQFLSATCARFCSNNPSKICIVYAIATSCFCYFDWVTSVRTAKFNSTIRFRYDSFLLSITLSVSVFVSLFISRSLNVFPPFHQAEKREQGAERLSNSYPKYTHLYLAPLEQCVGWNIQTKKEMKYRNNPYGVASNIPIRCYKYRKFPMRDRGNRANTVVENASYHQFISECEVAFRGEILWIQLDVCYFCYSLWLLCVFHTIPHSLSLSSYLSNDNVTSPWTKLRLICFVAALMKTYRRVSSSSMNVNLVQAHDSMD